MVASKLLWMLKGSSQDVCSSAVKKRLISPMVESEVYIFERTSTKRTALVGLAYQGLVSLKPAKTEMTDRLLSRKAGFFG
jgi:hypothetical protein